MSRLRVKTKRTYTELRTSRHIIRQNKQHEHITENRGRAQETQTTLDSRQNEEK